MPWHICKDIEIPVVIKDTGIHQLIFRIEAVRARFASLSSR